MRLRAGLLAASAAALVAVPIGAPPARAGASPTCSFSAVVDLDPGLSRLPSSGAFATPPGERGTYSCRGPYGWGKGPSGTATATGRYGTEGGDTCSEGGEGSGTLRLAGRTGTFTFTYGPFRDGVATGKFDSAQMAGTFDVTVLEGDCLTAPVTRVRLRGVGRPKR